MTTNSTHLNTHGTFYPEPVRVEIPIEDHCKPHRQYVQDVKSGLVEWNTEHCRKLITERDKAIAASLMNI